MEDQKIVKLLWQRAESAIEALARKFGNRLMSIAMNILGVRQDAEETVNDTYLAVWNTVPPRKPEPLAGYVYAIGRNISLDRLKYMTAEKRDGRYDVPIDELLCTMSRRKVQLALVGQSLSAPIGLITAEDILEELVGDFGEAESL